MKPTAGPARDTSPPSSPTSIAHPDGTHSFIFPIRNQFAMEVRSRYNLNATAIHRLTEFISARIPPESGKVQLPDEQRNMFGVLAIRQVPFVFWKLPPDLGFLTPHCETLRQEEGGDRVCALSRSLVQGNKTHFPNASDRIPGLLALAEFTVLEERWNELPPKEITLFKERIRLLHDIMEENTPDTVRPLYELFAACNIREILPPPDDPASFHPHGYEGSKAKTAFILTTSFWLEDILGIYEVFSREFARNLTRCVRPLGRKVIELGAGRAQLSTLLAEAGCGVHIATDIEPPVKTWKGRKVFKAPALKVVQQFGSRPLYVSAQPDESILENLLDSGKSLLLLQTGHNYAYILTPRMAHVEILPLSVPGYAGRSSDAVVRLLMIRMPEEERRQVKARTPEAFLLTEAAPES